MNQQIMNILQNEVKESQHTCKNSTLTIFYVGKRNSIHSSMPMGIPISPANFTQLLEQQSITKKRCKWCDGILD